ncbi:hypothetical protein [Vulcanisaeta distributa]|uniref:Uncharacterized protein n=1 Tax=Vulcanisaeta distributa (strain DSM 14429 / JCM 11212 / NBRC 100878 / IC-017) TaxID=572478 RepID=E1QP43_VULDI|nr:hypothetical protein [Vulcanisaeta distributa]ADN50214.1 hypothetical protein Vdis_0822 [Vulcanisaeta distributa DSM 14429]
MASFDDLKVSLSTYIMRNKRVTYQDLLKWSSSNKVGNTLLYLLIREVVREKRFKVSGEYVIGSIRVGNGEVKLSIPMYIEVPGEGVKPSVQAKRQVRQRRVRSSSILEVFGEEKRAEVKQSTVESSESERGEVKTTASEVKQEEQQKEDLRIAEHRDVEGIHGGDKVETGIKEEKEESTGIGAEGVVVPTDYSTVAMEDFTAMLRRAIEEELPQNREEGYKVAIAMLSYLQRYWSVGELRLKLDIAKQFGGVNEGIMRIEDGVLRALRKLGIVEVVEPGVVNRIKELPRDFIKVRLDSLFT